MTRLTNRWIAAATGAMLATGLAMAAAGPAQAFRGEVINVTAETTSNVKLINGVKFEVTRVERLVPDNGSEYQYEYELTGGDRFYAQMCSLTLNGSPVHEERPCDSVMTHGVTGMAESGQYTVASGDTVIASWVFNKPRKTPPPLKPAKCKILNIKQAGPAGKNGIPVKVVTNGKCSAPGVWSAPYSFSNGENQFAGIADMSTPVNGRAMIRIQPQYTNVNVTVWYNPDARVPATNADPVVLNRK